MIETPATMYRNDQRSPYYNARRHGYIECAICGELVHRDEAEYIGEDTVDIFGKIGYVHDQCIMKFEI